MKKIFLHGACFALLALRVHAQSPPTILNCPTAPVEFCDATANDPLLWDQPEFWNATLSVHNLPESQADLSLTAQNANPATLEFEYRLYLDLNADGIMETVVGADVPGAPNGMLRYDNAATPGFAGGTLRQFDQRPVPTKFKYRFRVDKTQVGNAVTAKVVWATGPGTGLGAKTLRLPYGTHKIRWFVTNDLGFQTTCEYVFTIKDCAPPTVVCLPGLSANIMPTGMITLWASDFLQYAEDNTGFQNFQMAIVPGGSSTTFPVDPLGNPLSSLTWNCDVLGTNAVDLWVRDAYGNTAFCTTYLIVQDNLLNCDGTGSALLICAKSLCNDAGLEEVSFEIEGTSPTLPPISIFDLNNSDGCADLNAVPMSSNYTITASKDDNPLNGVGTYDIVLINKHLNGTQPFQYAWQFIAADINNDGAVTGADTTELWNLIVGIYTELPNNSSWRFFVDSCDFYAPFPITCPQEIHLVDLSAGNNLGFAGIKIGDLNCSAVVNSLSGQGIDERTADEPPLVLAAQPNPTSGTAAIPLHLSAAMGVQLEVFDLSGRRTFASANPLDAGWQRLLLPAEAFPQAGVYAWRVRAGTTVRTGKIVRE